MSITRVLALLPLFVGLAHSFSWDIVLGEDNRLNFYYNGTVTRAENIPAANKLTSVTYDPVQYRVLFADYHYSNTSISSYDVSTREIQPLVTKITADKFMSLAYDPVTQLLFWVEDFQRIYSLSLKPASSNKANDGNLLVTLNHYCVDIAVDSCGGFIYWITEHTIERAAFDGSKREVLIDSELSWGLSLAIDQQALKMYWIDEIHHNQFSIRSADLNGKTRRTFYLIGTEYWASSLAVSKDFIYWSSSSQRAILQLTKSQQHGVGPIVYTESSRDCSNCQLTAANYTIEEQSLGIKSCEARKSLKLDVEERYGSICHNYCFEGNCSVNAEGHPKCRCNGGYSGERCEVYACHGYCLNNGDCFLNEHDEPVCQCAADYEGVRCEFPACRDSGVSTEGKCNCRCNAGNSGERKVNACHQYCLNDGVCSLNEDSAPVCQCTGDYEGDRCDVPAFITKLFLYAYKNIPPVTLCKGVKSTCASTFV